MRKRILSLALVLIALVCLMVVSASAAENRTQCVCGGKAAGKTGHTCENVTFEPWYETNSLPTEGNYYLTDHVTISERHQLSGNLNLDLNGFNITRKVTTIYTTQVFLISTNATMSVTDSTDEPGTITRDGAALSDTNKVKIADGAANNGLIFAINANTTGSLSLYDGIQEVSGLILLVPTHQNAPAFDSKAGALSRCIQIRCITFLYSYNPHLLSGASC